MNIHRAMFFWKNQFFGASALSLFVVACSGASSPDNAAPPAASAKTVESAPVVVAPSVSAPSPSASAALAPEPAPAASASAEPSASAAPSAAPAVPEAPLPDVQVKNIGMHIGGGPNDAPTKAPIHRSVEPHFDELKRCFAKVDDPKKGGDFGIDLLIDGKGGKARVSHPRTALRGEGFEACVVGVFEAIEFLRPKGGIKTMVSYSIRFTP